MSPSDASQSSSDIRPQADPLPPKVGELAYIAATEVTPRSEDQVDPNDIALRPHPAESTANLPSQSLNTSTSTTSLSLPLASSSSSTHTAKSKAQSIVGYFRGTSNTPMPTIHGIRLSTLLRVLFIIFALIGTALAWGLTIAMLQRRQARLTSEPDPNSNLPAPPPMSSSAATQSIIFIHIAFGILTVLSWLSSNAECSSRARSAIDSKIHWTHPRLRRGGMVAVEPVSVLLRGTDRASLRMQMRWASEVQATWRIMLSQRHHLPNTVIRAEAHSC